MKIKKILIANRGEIARRITETCRKRGIEVAVVYSEADEGLPFVREADEAICIGPPAVAQSYLKGSAVLKVAKEVGADAIHPGYGLLSENALFSRQVREAGLVFVGPPNDVIAQMGDKVKARKIMEEAGVPVIPGTEQGLADLDDAIAKAEEIGYPVMLKASAGGGGIGMQVLNSHEELRKAFPTAQNRAKAYFGDETLFMERFLPSPRHVEVQIMADCHGNVLHLFERECSIQRRNQKVVEESLSPSIRQETRSRLTEAALRAARFVGYIGAGTVEFLVDREENIYFLEMNTRLQVEHPVTEMITGYDLVDLQLDVAEGAVLPFSQEDVFAKGHAIEYRVYAEDPDTFLPSPGLIRAMNLPEGEGIRVDAGVEAGNQVTPFYDPMIAKCIVWGEDRNQALERSRKALSQFKVEGLKTNLSLLRKIVDDSVFIHGHYDTAFLYQHINEVKK